MYSKEALELYSSLLKQTTPPVKFESAPREKKANIGKAFGSAYKYLKARPLLSMGLGAAGTGVPAFALGSKAQEATNNWDKLKWGLTGAAAATAVPYLFKKLQGLQQGSGSYLGYKPGDSSGGYNSYDFTSI